MSRYRIDALRIVCGLSVALASASISCKIVDLRPVVVTTVPDSSYAVLANRDDIVTVLFSSEPEQLEVERAFFIKSPAGVVEGDFCWNQNGFTWKPVEPWDPGVRYRLILKGLIQTLDGREARPEIDLPFFVLRSSSQPSLLSFSPAPGSSVAVSTNHAAILQLDFSEAMDTQLTEAAFSLKPATDCVFTWNTDLSSLSITPKDQLAVCSVYRWSLGTEARAVDGTPLGRGERGIFITDLDSTPPHVERVYPVVRSGDIWIEAAADVSGLDAGHSLAVLFSEQVEPVSAISGIRIEPSQAGRSDAVTPRLFVYTPERDWLPGQPLSLVISADVKDSSGLVTGEEFRMRFTPLVPYLMINSASSSLDETTSDLNGSAILTAKLGNAPEGLCTLTLAFSAPFDSASKTAAAERISLSAFFPVWLPVPALRDLCWFSDDTVSLTWEGLRLNEAGTINYYRLLIPGGQGGVLSSKGLWLRDDAVLYLEVQN